VNSEAIARARRCHPGQQRGGQEKNNRKKISPFYLANIDFEFVSQSLETITYKVQVYVLKTGLWSESYNRLIHCQTAGLAAREPGSILEQIVFQNCAPRTEFSVCRLELNFILSV
jgi:hypothetical protein